MLQASVKDRILKPVAEVREAIVDPALMSGYFISGGDRRMQAGESVRWEFADVGGELAVDVEEVGDDAVRFRWGASGVDSKVEIELEPYDDDSTVVTITETGWPMDDDGVARALEQTAGWGDFLCSMKAFLVYGVKLREGRTAATH
jgi:uncharacterized protein YndB with AHSA1/START domain